MSKVSSLSAIPGSLLGSGISVLKRGETLTPYTYNWNFIVSQQVPLKSTLELQYMGSHNDNGVYDNASNSSLANINKIPVGTLLSSAACISNPDYCGSKVTGTSYTSTPGYTDQQYYRPYADYTYIAVARHGSYSNYNAFVAQWQKQSGPFTGLVNYTFSKVLGIQDNNTTNGQGSGGTVDPFNVKNNYGILAYDHTHIFNASYVYHLPSPVHKNVLAAGAVNGWELSGVTQMQSGAPLQTNTYSFHFSSPVSVEDVLGTPDGDALPILTCNPKSGLHSGMYFNPSCFGLPKAGTPATSSSAATLGTNGPTQWPYIKGPAFVSSDLGLFKNFKVGERQNVQFRAQAFNFLNHKLKQFGTGNDTELIMSAVKNDPTAFTLPSDFNGKPEGITGRRVMEFTLKYLF